jgi:hypothetical protein
MPDLVVGLVSALLEVFFKAIGRRLLNFFGWRKPDQIASFFTGMAFWIVVCLLVYVTLSG